MSNNFQEIARNSTDVLGMPGLDEVRPFVSPEPISTLTDDDLVNEASADNGGYVTWDNLAEYGYGIPESDLPISAWRRRFDCEYMKTLRRSDHFASEPGDFVEAVWRSQRVLPTVGEYAQLLGEQSILRPDEVQIASLISTIEDMPDALERSDAIQQMSEDEQWQYHKMRAKLEYLINVHPDSQAAQGDVGKHAEEYAWKLAQGNSNPKAAQQAHVLLLEARGLSSEEVKAAAGVSNLRSHRSSIGYRTLGVEPDQAAHMAENAGGPMMKPWQDPVWKMTEALSGNLNTQLAVRKFLGTANLYELLNYQARTDRMHQGRPDLAYKFADAAMNMNAVSIDPGVLEASSPMDINLEDSNFSEPGFTSEETRRYEQLAAFVVHEPVLQDNLHHAVKLELVERYLTWIDTNSSL